MTRLAIGSVAFMLLTFAAACGRDSSRNEVVAPEASGDIESVASGGANLASRAHSHYIAMLDDCDPTDPAWNPVGGCALSQGSVSFAEFGAELSSTLALTSVIGHPSWRNDPAYTVIGTGQSLHVRNAGGRAHTFTEVAQFGGGKVPNPALNKGLATAPECPGSVDIAPGGGTSVSGLQAGNHRFQCCIHPWMRAVVEVTAK
jgi:hypothetical protein